MPGSIPIRRWLIFSVKLMVFAVVAYFIWHSIVDAWRQIKREQFSLADVHPGWLVVAGALFLLSQLPMAWFWHISMVQLGQQPRWWDVARAYLIGGLGKYVPGKAMVVVLRAGMVRGPGVDTTVAALCVFIETLTMMAVGGFLGSMYLIASEVRSGRLTIMLPIAIGLTLATGVPTLPPIFRRVVLWLRVSKAKADIDHLLRRLDYHLMACGWAANLIAWPLMGLSLWATLRAMPGTHEALASPWATLPLMTASIGLAVVAGFASMIPGGLGIREFFLNMLMVPIFGKLAIISVILLRLVWLLAELAVSGILYVAGRSAADLHVGDAGRFKSQIPNDKSQTIPNPQIPNG